MERDAKVVEQSISVMPRARGLKYASVLALIVGTVLLTLKRKGLTNRFLIKSSGGINAAGRQ